MKTVNRHLTVKSLFTTLMLLPLGLAAQTYTWIGGGGEVSNQFSNSANWLGAPDGPGAPGNSSGYRNFVFGASDSDYYGPLMQDLNNFRVASLLFTADAGQYVLGGDGDETIWLLNSANPRRGSPTVGSGGIIINRSNYEQIIGTSIGLFLAGNSFSGIDVGRAGVRLNGGTVSQSPIPGGWQHSMMEVFGSGTLTLGGSNRIGELWVYGGKVVLDGDAGYSPELTTMITFRDGGELLVLGKSGENTTNLTMLLGNTEFAFGQYKSSLHSNRSARITLDANGGDGTHLTFTNWLGNQNGRTGGVPVRVATMNFRLKENTSIHFNEIHQAAQFIGVDGVVYWSTLTEVDEHGNSLTGFLRLQNVGGYDAVRYTGGTALPGNQNQLTGGNYYVDGDHTIVGTNIAGNVRARTLTLKNSGTLTVSSGLFFAGNILLEEGTGDYTIATPWLSPDIGADSISQTRQGTLTLHQYRTTGNLIIAADRLGTWSGDTTHVNTWRFVTTGPGTVILRSPSHTNNAISMVGGTWVQEGRLQLEGDALDQTSEVNVWGTLAGSGKIGGGERWIRNGSNNGNLIDGIRYTPVRVYMGGTLDATPGVHMSEAGLRGLQIHGTVQLHDEAAFAMNLTSDVLAGNYNPLRVTKDPSSSDPTVVLLNDVYGVDLQLVLQGHISGETWITLLETDGSINGVFSTINGGSFGAGNSFVLSYAGTDYDFILHYNYNLGGEDVGLVLQAIPEPATVALLFGVMGLGVLFYRRTRRS